jgi:hypothetical protein
MQNKKSAYEVKKSSIRCEVCGKKFAQRKLVKFQGLNYHEECLHKVTHKGKKYGGIKQKDKRPAMRQV